MPAKAPAGYTPVPNSKRGGYRKRKAGGGFDYWYPPKGGGQRKRKAARKPRDYRSLNMVNDADYEKHMREVAKRAGWPVHGQYRANDATGRTRTYNEFAVSFGGNSIRKALGNNPDPAKVERFVKLAAQHAAEQYRRDGDDFPASEIEADIRNTQHVAYRAREGVKLVDLAISEIVSSYPSDMRDNLRPNGEYAALDLIAQVFKGDTMSKALEILDGYGEPVRLVVTPTELAKARGGEGSRGGHIIGHRPNGAPIYAGKKFSEHHAQTSPTDLEEGARAQGAKAREHFKAADEARVKDDAHAWGYHKQLGRHHQQLKVAHRAMASGDSRRADVEAGSATRNYEHVQRLSKGCDRMAKAQPVGGGWEPIPGGKHGGYRKRGSAGHYIYHYPSKEAAKQAAAHHEKKADYHSARFDHHSDKAMAALDEHDYEAMDKHDARTDHHAHHHGEHRAAQHAAEHFARHGRHQVHRIGGYDSAKEEGWEDEPRTHGHYYGDPHDADHAYEIRHYEGYHADEPAEAVVEHGRARDYGDGPNVRDGKRIARFTGKNASQQAHAAMYAHIRGRAHDRDAPGKAKTKQLEKGTRLVVRADLTEDLAKAFSPTRIDGSGFLSHWEEDGFQFGFSKSERGVGVLSVMHDSFQMPYHIVANSLRMAKGMVANLITDFKAGRTPGRGVFRRMELAPARWGG